ncbi:MAG: MgtC/SapB family protein [Bacteroidaceae bacterium]|nr:MgtC/SapB family protein [Bacteroidaceae bacterium]
MTMDFVLRLVVAGILGVLIGLEREYRAKEAGYRTHFLVAVGSALLMIVSQHGFDDMLGKEGVGLDPSRIAAQIVTGIGFIGAGTIILNRQIVRGLTTAAGIWATAGIGMCAGAGMYALAISATVLTLIGLELLSRLFKNLGLKSFIIEFSTHNKDIPKIISSSLTKGEFMVVSYQMDERGTGDTATFDVTMVVKSKRKDDEANLVALLNGYEDVVVRRIE